MAVTGVELNESSISLAIDSDENTKQLITTLEPEDANEMVTW